MQQVRKLHLAIEIQSMSKVFVILEHVQMKNNAKRPRQQVAFDDRRSAFFIPLNCSGFQGTDITTIDSTQ